MKILVSGSTRTVRNLAAQYQQNLGVLLTPNNRNSVSSVLATGLVWAVDNGAFIGFNPVLFRRCLRRVAGQQRLLWVVCPDVVADARATLALFCEWHEEITQSGPVAFVGQDGQEDFDLPWQRFKCFFLGGSTGWKLSRAAADLVAEARRRHKWVHMGRVNTLRRLRTAYDLRCDSVDGSCFSRWADQYLQWALRWLVHLEQQPQLY